jgi:hypothetical protein
LPDVNADPPLAYDGDVLTTAHPPEVWARIEASAAHFQAAPPRAEPQPTSAPPPKSQGTPQAAANVRVREYLKKHAKNNLDAMTIRKIAEATKVSVGAVGKSPSWKAFHERRKKGRLGRGRTTPLTKELLATIQPDDSGTVDRDELLAAEIESQTREIRADNRLPRRNQSRS